MRTNILKKLHELQIKELKLIAECKKQIENAKRMIETKEQTVNTTYDIHFAWSLSELKNHLKRLEKINERLFTWYWQTLNKIMYYSNK